MEIAREISDRAAHKVALIDAGGIGNHENQHFLNLLNKLVNECAAYVLDRVAGEFDEAFLELQKRLDHIKSDTTYYSWPEIESLKMMIRLNRESAKKIREM